MSSGRSPDVPTAGWASPGVTSTPPRAPDTQSRLSVRLVALVLVIVCLGAAAFVLRLRTGMADFEVYRTAGARATAAEPLYRDSDAHYQFKYLPASAFLFVPFALVPIGAAKAAWFALSVGSLVVLLVLSLRYLPAPLVPAPLLLGATVVTLAKFYAHELVLGQANLLLGAMALAGLGLLIRRRERTAGAVWGAAVALKPYALIFLPYLVATRRFGASAAFVAVIAAIGIAPAAVYGVQGNADLIWSWAGTVTSSTPANLTNPDNVSIAAMYAKWLGPGPLSTWLTVATVLALLALCGAVVAMRAGVSRRHAGAPEYLEVALLLTTVALFSPQGWDYLLLLATPAVMLLVNVLPRLGRPVQLAIACVVAGMGLTLYDLMGRAAYARFMELSLMTVISGGVVGFLFYIRARQLH